MADCAICFAKSASIMDIPTDALPYRVARFCVSGV
jgi:hypothetical protein